MVTKGVFIWSVKNSKTVLLWNNCYLFEYILNVIYSCDGETQHLEAITPVFTVKFYLLCWNLSDTAWFLFE